MNWVVSRTIYKQLTYVVLDQVVVSEGTSLYWVPYLLLLSVTKDYVGIPLTICPRQ